MTNSPGINQIIGTYHCPDCGADVLETWRARHKRTHEAERWLDAELLRSCRVCKAPATRTLRLHHGTVVAMCDDHSQILIDKGWMGEPVTVLEGQS